MAGRRPVPGPHAALHHVRQRAADDARGLHRQDHGVLDLHLSGPPPHAPRRRRRCSRTLSAPRFYFTSKTSFRLSYEICYEDLTLLQVSLFNFSTDESDNDFCIRIVTRNVATRTDSGRSRRRYIETSTRISSQMY